MKPTEEALRLALRGSALADQIERQDSDPPVGSPSLLARTATLATYPTAAASYFTCQPLVLLGPEVEGGVGTLVPQSSTFFAFNLGSTLPPPGTTVLATFVGNRWVFRYDS